MGAFVAKQPNGLYCRFSTVVDCPTDWNLTEEEYINICMQKAKEEAQDTLKNYLVDFREVRDRFKPTSNMNNREYKIFLTAVGGDD